MKEYQRRIQEHEKRLPHLREKIAAAIVLFIVASLMLSVVTFAWLTLSVAPEASNITMSMAANGSLEIALAYDVLRDANGDPILDENGNVQPLAPGASHVGDSNLDLILKNRTWGNLVNLSDPVYGLENIVLRPATLKTDSLLSKPLYAAKYTTDGRIERTRSDFAYAQWNPALSQFTKSDYMGIKAISSIKETGVNVTNPLLEKYNDMIDSVGSSFDTAGSEFRALATSSHMVAINGLMSTYMNGTLNQDVDNQLCTAEDIDSFYLMMEEVLNGTMQYMGEAYMQLIEIYQIDTYGLNEYTPYTDINTFCSEISTYINTLNSARTAKGKAEVSIATIKQFATDYNGLKTQMQNLSKYRGSQTTKWGEIKSIVNFVVDINSCEVNGKTISSLLGSLSANMTALTNMLSNSADKNNAIVKKGLLKRLDLMLYNGIDSFYIPKATITIQREAFEKRISGQNSFVQSMAMNAAGFSGNAQTKEVYANIRTDATSDTTGATVYKDTNNTLKALDAEIKVTDFIAQDTYGLSVDFWVKTNAANSYLLLEGEVRYTPIDVVKTIVITNEDGSPTEYKDIPIYLATVKTTSVKGTESEEMIAQDQEVYKLDDGIWRYLSNNEPVEKSESGTVDDENGNQIEASLTVEISGEPEKKQDKIISGYSGANRIWTEEELINMSESEYRTTQGAGSCYTFYADPAEAEQIMEILAALKIAFVDQSGNLIGSARLATELCYSEYGKHTVPIVLADSCMKTGRVDDNGDPIYAITQLEKNVPTLITAIIYLDGAVVSNDKVLSSSNIEGSFNIQFGSTDVLEPIENEELMGDEIRVSGSIVGGNPTVDFSEDMEINGYKVNVALNIDGSTPSSVYAYFLRKISATQGTKQEKLVFTMNASGEWVAEMTFHSPGEYILRSVIVDGIERDLEIAEGAQPPTVTINGFSCTNFHGVNGQNYTYRTASSFVNERFYVTVSAKDNRLVPKSVEAIFIGDNGKTVTVNLTDSNGDTTYEGLATFQSSGSYTCQYLIVDGDYYELTVPYIRDIYTGLRVSVWISQREGDTPFTDLEKPLGMEILSAKGYQYIFSVPHSFDIQMKIYDNAGNAIEGLTDVSIFYTGDTDATLRWDAAARQYTGQLPTITAPGTYTFKSVVVGSEVINSARSAMSIIAIPNSPVYYNGIDGEIVEQVILIEGYSDNDSSATVSLKFTNAESAEVFGLFEKVNETGTTNYIIKADQNKTDKNIYTFTIPDEDGDWTLKEVKMSLVYDGDTETFFMGNETFEGLFEESNVISANGDYGEEKDVNIWDKATDAEYYIVTDTKNEWTGTRVIKQLSHTETYTDEYKGNNFMVEYDATGNDNSVTFNDMFNGEIVKDVIDVKLIYRRQAGTAEDYGGYTWSEDGSSNDTVTVTLKKSSTADGKVTFTKDTVDNKLKVAGLYDVTLSYKYKDTTFTVPLSKTVAVKSEVPTVAITGISPTAGSKISVDKNGAGSGHTDNVTVPASTATSATVYFSCSKTDKTTCTSERHNYTRPSVTITLTGFGAAESAELSFGSSSHVYNGTTRTGTYAWTANGTATRNIGYFNSRTASTDDKTPAGEITASVLTFTKDGVAYTFTLPEDKQITINNPY